MSDTPERKPTPPSAIGPANRPAMSCDEAIATWIDMLNAGTKLLRAGLRREVGPTGDVDAAYRRWYAKQMEDHHRKVRRILQRLHDAEVENAG